MSPGLDVITRLEYEQRQGAQGQTLGHMYVLTLGKMGSREKGKKDSYIEEPDQEAAANKLGGKSGKCGILQAN